MAGAILTQNTNWGNAARALESLSRKGLLKPEAIIAVSHERLARAITSSGYYNQKAIKLKSLAEFLKLNSIAALLGMDMADLRSGLLAIWGIGEETADSIILYALEKPIFVVDAYTRRLFHRLGLLSEKASYPETQLLFHQHLEADLEVYKEYHALIVQYCKDVCKKKPLCKNCFLKSMCGHGQNSKI